MRDGSAGMTIPGLIFLHGREVNPELIAHLPERQASGLSEFTSTTLLKHAAQPDEIAQVLWLEWLGHAVSLRPETFRIQGLRRCQRKGVDSP